MNDGSKLIIGLARALGAAEAALIGIRAEATSAMPARDAPITIIMTDRLSRIAALVERAESDIARLTERGQ